MAVRSILEQGDPILKKKCRLVTDFNPRLYVLLDDMKETLQKVGGAGLAAPQVSVLRRVCIIWKEDTDEYLEIINPEIEREEGEQTGLEGCLSVPGKWGIVTRPEFVVVRAQDRNGEWQTFEAHGLMARAFCHEIEHLDGHMYTEHIDHFLTDDEIREYQELENSQNTDLDEGAENIENSESLQTSYS